MTTIIFRFGILAFALLALFQISKYTLLVPDFRDSLWIVLFGALFIALGLVLGKHVFAPTLRDEASEEAIQTSNASLVSTLGITKREHEVLLQIAKGLSNKEIADALFVSESTIKTHVSNLFAKLGAKRRTHVITRAKELNIID